MTPPRTRIEKRRDDRTVSREQAEANHADPGTTRNRAWDGQKDGFAGEGFSKGYGGSEGPGTGAAGPEEKSSQEKPRGRRR